MNITCYYKKESNTLSGSVLGVKRRLKKVTKRLEKHETGHSASRSFTIGLISGMNQLDYRHFQFPATYFYIAQKPAIWRVFHGGTIWIRTKDLFDVNEAL